MDTCSNVICLDPESYRLVRKWIKDQGRPTINRSNRRATARFIQRRDVAKGMTREEVTARRKVDAGRVGPAPLASAPDRIPTKES